MAMAEAIGSTPDHVLINLSHTHSAGALLRMQPEFADQAELLTSYQQMLGERLVEAAGEAAGAMQPARIGAGSGTSHIGVQRRERGADGYVFLGEVPDGPIDPVVGVVRVDDLAGPADRDPGRLRLSHGHRRTQCRGRVARLRGTHAADGGAHPGRPVPVPPGRRRRHHALLGHGLRGRRSGQQGAGRARCWAPRWCGSRRPSGRPSDVETASGRPRSMARASRCDHWCPSMGRPAKRSGHGPPACTVDLVELPSCRTWRGRSTQRAAGTWR